MAGRWLQNVDHHLVIAVRQDSRNAVDHARVFIALLRFIYRRLPRLWRLARCSERRIRYVIM